jgi:hypothetical protein
MPAEMAVTDLRVDIGVMKRDIVSITQLCEKMDKVIEKLVDHQDVIINQIYNDMDKRKADTNSEIKDLHSRITTVTREVSDRVNEMETRIMEEIKALRIELKAHNDFEDSELKKLLQWKWTIVGGLIVLSWLTSHVDFVKMFISP